MQKYETSALPFQFIVKSNEFPLPSIEFFDGEKLYFRTPVDITDWSDPLFVKLRFDGVVKTISTWNLIENDKVCGLGLHLEIKDKLKLIQRLCMAQRS